MAKVTWLHVSDIHFNSKKEWRDSDSTKTLIKHLKTQFSSGALPKPDLVFCTGDIAFGETSANPLSAQYESAKTFFDELLKVCGKDGNSLPKENLFFVPGNHDVNRNAVNADAQQWLIDASKTSHRHIAKINQRFNDRTIEFKSAIARLAEYSDFIESYLPHQHDEDGRHCYSAVREINGVKIGIAGFNSAWTCSGPEDDRNIWLAASWQFNRANKNIKECDIKIGLIHHPTDWLNQADRDVANQKIPQQYDFWLHGHTHNAFVSAAQTHITIAAGAIGAEYSEEFGVNITQANLLERNGTSYLLAKKSNCDWTIAPVPQFAPLGQWQFTLPEKLNYIAAKPHTVSTVVTFRNPECDLITERHFHIRFRKSLELFSGHSSEWVEPVISPEPESNSRTTADAVEKIDLTSLISTPKNVTFCAPAQYGQTCLAHYMIKEAWEHHKSYWLYLDARGLKANKDSILKQMNSELEASSRMESEIACVIVDSWSSEDRDAHKLMNKIYEYFQNTPVIRMQQISGTLAKVKESLSRESDSLYLWSLPRESIRKIVTAYNDKRPMGEESTITSRIISDMDVLNLHRTPLNCLTLLKVSELDFDENPVNRTEIIKRVLFLLFNVGDLPTYKSKPDLKDCEHVLGYLCEQLIKEGSYGFTRERFLKDLQNHAQSQLMDLETQVVFDILYTNNIIIQRAELFYFRFSYWLFYFAAQRMHHNDAFARYILDEMRYTQHPEIIEFYTGADRRREDALTVLCNDLNTLRIEVQKKCGLPENMNPYRLGKWKTTDENARKRMQKEVADGVAKSNLPDVVKDRYADSNYDQRKPYYQVAGSVLQEHNFVRLIQAIKAGSRALRNSDYAQIDLKKELLSEILRSWEQVTRIILTVLPALAERSHVSYDGVNIILISDIANIDSFEEKFVTILSLIPFSVSREFSDDLFSMKMGPLLTDRLSSPTTSEIAKHELILLLIMKRPRDWQKSVSAYINQVQHNSFYLYDIYSCLRSQYEYAFVTTKTLEDIESLIRQAGAKHMFGSKSPSAKQMDNIKNAVPNRKI